MNVYMDISIILFSFVVLTTVYTVLKTTTKRFIKFSIASTISVILLVIIWRSLSIITYFH
ncbi:hypothetical protein IMZ08_18325 [Bacillus luteolus]|uniref:Uncharacterized protein n=1 Tax=Litchfieldia luteola TaxID=682179 RepID=A0ABR9QNC0_9BACI|nr:hypothetical protein [Cytobacillus luteolus]MBE4909997.1 hypothetical protein [Cytobacillus luteolus]MBP1942443.1 hypothetical protein [Cytobacillus luteolus]